MSPARGNLSRHPGFRLRGCRPLLLRADVRTQRPRWVPALGLRTAARSVLSDRKSSPSYPSSEPLSMFYINLSDHAITGHQSPGAARERRRPYVKRQDPPVQLSNRWRAGPS